MTSPAVMQELIEGDPSDAHLDDVLLRQLWYGHWVFRWPLWLAGLGSLVFALAMGYTIVAGIGTWGNNIPVAWAFAITNFVWWIGIGHAGTFISAILLITQQKWRTSINRLTEGMTLFAVMCAGVWPLLHMGRPWFFYWLTPYPATMAVWPQFRSSLTWDVAAVFTYFTVSLLFWYLGLIPDLACARDRAPTLLQRRIYGVAALGWRGSARHWQRVRSAYAIMGAIATALVVSVHSVVSLDFSIAKEPGWHSTIFPPYFVAGAIFSGFAMVATLMLPLRTLLGWHQVITGRHLDNIAKVLLVTGSIVGYSYALEAGMAWWSGDRWDAFLQLHSRPFGPWGWMFWMTVVCNVLVPQIFWWRRARRSAWTLFIAAAFIQVGMWSERFVIVAGSLRQDFLPSSWHSYSPSILDLTLLGGSLSFFLFCFLLFVRFVPPIPLSDLKSLKREIAEAKRILAKEASRAA